MNDVNNCMKTVMDARVEDTGFFISAEELAVYESAPDFKARYCESFARRVELDRMVIMKGGNYA